VAGSCWRLAISYQPPAILQPEQLLKQCSNQIELLTTLTAWGVYVKIWYAGQPLRFLGFTTDQNS
jgi:hypothetical protein